MDKTLTKPELKTISPTLVGWLEHRQEQTEKPGMSLAASMGLLGLIIQESYGSMEYAGESNRIIGMAKFVRDFIDHDNLRQTGIEERTPFDLFDQFRATLSCFYEECYELVDGALVHGYINAKDKAKSRGECMTAQEAQRRLLKTASVKLSRYNIAWEFIGEEEEAEEELYIAMTRRLFMHLFNTKQALHFISKANLSKPEGIVEDLTRSRMGLISVKIFPFGDHFESAFRMAGTQTLH
ncbi:MAG: hypothetical protein QY318_00550 [Candidatus Dojkabacteria bacterium]|nr:MAG: hypothetical protein QY318_00550 [Candidatus Dojkabacteria bacterium]